MVRRLAVFGVSASLSCLAYGHSVLAQVAVPSPPTVPTATKVTRTPDPKPPTTPAAPTPVPAAAPTPLPPPGSVERARQGVVSIERQGKPLGLGVVLEGDGRILSALSPLTNGNFLSARYADGVVVPLKLVHSDRGWDLALLGPTPAPGAEATRKTGLRAARTPSFSALQTFGIEKGKLAALPAALKLGPSLLGGDDTSLAGAYELGNRNALVGAPVVNLEGEVVALVARACPGGSKAGCVAAPYGAPVSALKQFLQRVPTEATWLGVDVTSDEAHGVRGVRVVSVIPDSPAANGGVRPGRDANEADLVVAIDGTPVATPSDLNEAVRARTSGDNIELLLFGLGRYRHVSVKPRSAPQLIQAPVVTPAPPKPRVPNPYR